MGYVPGVGYLPNIDRKNYALSGMERGQAMRKSALDMEAQQQTMQRGALKHKQSQQDRQRELMGVGAAQVLDQPSYDRFRNFMKTDLGETEAPPFMIPVILVAIL